VCLLLALSLFYNPFANLVPSHGLLEFHTHARHRAAVGSSELEHFSPVSRASERTAETAAAVTLERPAEAKQFREFVPPRAPRAARPEFAASLWFRPPPAA
jgi:hypothetical protein